MGSLPASFEKSGFVTPSKTRAKIPLGNGVFLKPLLIGTDGQTDSGKTEFALSAPGIIQMCSIDRNFQGVFDNPYPPPTRNPRVGIKVFQPPLNGTAKITDYQQYYALIRAGFYDALDNRESTVVVVDGDSDFWEIHILAHFGKNTQIYPQTRYAAPYAEKRAQIARAWDSGKIVICTNKVKDEYETVRKADGTPEKDPVNGEDLRRKTGNKERQGFKDTDYLWDLQLSHMHRPAHVRQMGLLPNKQPRMVNVPMQWGVRITKCKHNMAMVGEELWGDQCNFKGLVELVFPEVPLARWGFKA
jgi:hypothetical protein